MTIRAAGATDWADTRVVENEQKRVPLSIKVTDSAFIGPHKDTAARSVYHELKTLIWPHVGRAAGARTRGTEWIADVHDGIHR